jgi:hypothetical protein
MLRRDKSMKIDEVALLSKESNEFVLPEEAQEEDETPKVEWTNEETPEEKEDDPTFEELEEELEKLQLKLNRRRSSIPYLGEINIGDSIELKTVLVPVEQEQPRKKIVPKFR